MAASPAQIQQICERERQAARDFSHSLPPRPFDFFGVPTNFGTVGYFFLGVVIGGRFGFFGALLGFCIAMFHLLLR